MCVIFGLFEHMAGTLSSLAEGSVSGSRLAHGMILLRQYIGYFALQIDISYSFFEAELLRRRNSPLDVWF